MNEFEVTGTFIWYFYVCKREVWLMARKITPNEDDDNLVIGRQIHEEHYKDLKKELSFANGKIDFIKKNGNNFVVGEVKKSSKHKLSAKMQLLFYLLKLKELGIEAVGELHFPEERVVEKVILNKNEEIELKNTIIEIEKIVEMEVPPKANKIPVCKQCAYREFCWS